MMDSMGLTPEMIQGILSAGDDDPDFGEAKRKQALIDKLRNNGLSGPAPQQMAGPMLLPNWGDTLSRTMQGAAGHMMQPGVDQQIRGAQGRSNQARSNYMDALIKAMRRQAPGQPQQMSPGNAGDEFTYPGSY